MSNVPASVIASIPFSSGRAFMSGALVTNLVALNDRGADSGIEKHGTQPYSSPRLAPTPSYL